MNWPEDFRKNGFAIVPNVMGVAQIEALSETLAQVQLNASVKQRAGRAFGIRRLLEVVPAVRALAESAQLQSMIAPILGEQSRVVRGIFFDKTPVANWKVPWHQDVTIAVRERKEVAGFVAWSIKAGVIHVQPPIEILESIVTVRLHLDDTDETNGALRVIPGSHQQGLLSDEMIQQCKAQQIAVTCRVERGGVLFMRPLLLHASSTATQPAHRRVLHLEYSAMDLPDGLKWYGS